LECGDKVVAEGMPNMPRIYADFHKMDEKGRLISICIGTKKDSEKYGIEFQKGMVITFYSDDADDGNRDNLLGEGIVSYDVENQYWTATIDWDSVRHVSEEES
jgi:hypothetical protein